MNVPTVITAIAVPLLVTLTSLVTWHFSGRRCSVKARQDDQCTVTLTVTPKGRLPVGVEVIGVRYSDGTGKSNVDRDGPSLPVTLEEHSRSWVLQPAYKMTTAQRVKVGVKLGHRTRRTWARHWWGLRQAFTVEPSDASIRIFVY